MFYVLLFRDIFLMGLTFWASVIILQSATELTAIWNSGDDFINCFYFAWVDEWSIAIKMSVCLFDCLSVCRSLCLSVCLSLSLSLAYLKNRMSNFHELFCTCYLWHGSILVWQQCNMLICYVLLVLWITSCFHVLEWMGKNQIWHISFEFARWRHKSNVTRHCLVKFARMTAPGAKSAISYCI